jgi:RNA polymerase sigma-70 factor (ECF subfamily)
VRKKKDLAPLGKADRDFFQGFFEEYKNLIYRSASAYTAGADLEDLVQEAVVRLMKNISVLRQLTRCKVAYYIVITVRTAYIDMLRAKQRITLVSFEDDEQLLCALADAAPQNATETELLMRMAVKSLKQSLPEKEWLVLEGKVILGYTHEELGAMLDMDPVNVRATLSRAKRKARQILRQEQWIGDDGDA